MGDVDDHVRGGAVHRCTSACEVPVRCIVCNRLKAPIGATVPPELVGMRCEPSCDGYRLDPRPGHRWPRFETLAATLPVAATELVGALPSADPTGDRAMPSAPADLGSGGDDLLAWALHQSHPPRRAEGRRSPVTYRIACLLMVDEVPEVVARLVQAGCLVGQLCEALGSVVLEVSGDPLAIIEVIDRWDGTGRLEIVPPPPGSSDL